MKDDYPAHMQPDPTPRHIRCHIESRYLVWYFWSVEVVAVHWRRSAALPIDCIEYLSGRGLRAEADRLRESAKRALGRK